MSSVETSPAEAAPDDAVSGGDSPPSTPAIVASGVASAGDLSMTPNAVRLRERRAARPHLCRKCAQPCQPEFFVCDACTDPEHARRRSAGLRKRDRSAAGLAEAAAREAELAALSPYSAAIDAAITELEKHSSRALKLARDADAGVRQMPRAQR